MTLQVQSNASSIKLINSTNRAGNLLKIAIHGLPGGLGTSRPRDDAGAFGLEGSFAQPVDVIVKKPTLLEELPAEETDQFLASASGLARMGGIFQTMKDTPSINPEEALNSAQHARFAISGNPMLAMDAQANQRAISVVKLLE
jgi:hypothetical protein